MPLAASTHEAAIPHWVLKKSVGLLMYDGSSYQPVVRSSQVIFSLHNPATRPEKQLVQTQLGQSNNSLPPQGSQLDWSKATSQPSWNNGAHHIVSSISLNHKWFACTINTGESFTFNLVFWKVLSSLLSGCVTLPSTSLEEIGQRFGQRWIFPYWLLQEDSKSYKSSKAPNHLRYRPILIPLGKFYVLDIRALYKRTHTLILSCIAFLILVSPRQYANARHAHRVSYYKLKYHLTIPL